MRVTRFALCLWPLCLGLAGVSALNLQPRQAWNASADVVFGQTAAFSGTALDLGVNVRRGILAAFLEWNLRGAGPSFGLVSYDDGYEPQPTRDNMKLLIETEQVFAVLGLIGTPNAAAGMPLSVANRVPLIGSVSGGLFLRRPFQRYVLNYRGSLIDETAAMVRTCVEKLYMSRVSVFWQDDSFGQTGRQGVRQALRRYRLRIHSEGKYVRGTMNVLPGLQAMAASPPPHAVVILGTTGPLAKFVVEAKKLWPTAAFFTVSFVSSQEFGRILATPGNRSNVYITQVVDFPNSTTPLASEYRAALAAYDPAAIPEFTSFEGYIMGRWAAETAGTIWRPQANQSALREAFLDSIYRRGIVQLGSARLGPFGDGSGLCRQPETGCQCNQAQRSVFGTTVLADGQLAPFPLLDFSFTTCGYDAAQWAVKLGVTAPLSGPAAELGRAVLLGLQAAFKAAADADVLGEASIELVPYDDGGDAQRSRVNAERLIGSDLVFGLVGTVGSDAAREVLEAAASSDALVLGALSGADFLRWPFSRQVANVRAGDADEAFAAVDHVVGLGKRSVSVFFQNDTSGRSYRAAFDAALRAHGLTFRGEALLDPLRPSSELASALDAIAVAGGPEVLVLLAPFWVAAEFLRLASGRWPNCLFVAVSSVGVDELAKRVPPSVSLLATQVVPLPQDNRSSLAAAFRRDVAAFNATAVPTQSALEAYLVGRSVVSVLASMPAGIARATFREVLYNSRTIAVEDVTLGPFTDTGAGGLQCNQGSRQVYLTRLLPSGELGYASKGPFAFAACGLRSPQCIDGYYRAASSAVCSPCAPGNSISEDGRTCGPCPPGFRGAASSSSPCVPCPSGFTTTTAGQVRCEPIKPDPTQCIEGFGLATASGEYVTSRTAAVKCAVCVAGRFSQHLANASAGNAGNAGSTGNVTDTFVCQACPPGSRQPRPAATHCDPCAEGFHAADAGMTECARCGRGTYAGIPGAVHCSVCPAQQTTAETGSTSELECICPSGTFQEAGDNGTMFVALCHHCSDSFPAHTVDCAGGQAPPVVAAGYMTPVGSSRVFKCQSAQACPGGVPVGTDSCPAGSTSVACALCAPSFQYSVSQGHCVPCSEWPVAIFWLIVAVGFVILVFKLRPHEVDYSVLSLEREIATVFVMVPLAQCVDLLQFQSILGRISIDESLSTASVSFFSGVFTFKSFGVECFIASDKKAYAVRYMVLANLMPAFFIASCVLVVWPEKLCPALWRKWRLPSRLRAVSTAITVVLMTYLTILNLALNLVFSSYMHPDGVTRSLQSFPHILTSDPEMKALTGIAVCAILLWCCGTVALVVFLLRTLPTSRGNFFLRRCALPVFARYSEEHAWWVLVDVCMKLLTSITLSIFDMPGTQLVWLSSIYLAYSVGACLVRPFRFPRHCVLDVLLAFGKVLLVILSMEQLVNAGGSSERVAVLSYVMYAVGAAGFLVCLVDRCRRRSCSVDVDDGLFEKARWLARRVIHVQPDPSELAPGGQALQIVRTESKLPSVMIPGTVSV